MRRLNSALTNGLRMLLALWNMTYVLMKTSFQASRGSYPLSTGGGQQMDDGLMTELPPRPTRFPAKFSNVEKIGLGNICQQTYACHRDCFSKVVAEGSCTVPSLITKTDFVWLSLNKQDICLWSIWSGFLGLAREQFSTVLLRILMDHCQYLQQRPDWWFWMAELIVSNSFMPKGQDRFCVTRIECQSSALVSMPALHEENTPMRKPIRCEIPSSTSLCIRLRPQREIKILMWMSTKERSIPRMEQKKSTVFSIGLAIKKRGWTGTLIFCIECKELWGNLTSKLSPVILSQILYAYFKLGTITVSLIGLQMYSMLYSAWEGKQIKLGMSKVPSNAAPLQ